MEAGAPYTVSEPWGLWSESPASWALRELRKCSFGGPKGGHTPRSGPAGPGTRSSCDLSDYPLVARPSASSPEP